MTLYNSFILGLLQGITEFLPISSSGHLILMEHYLGISIAPTILQHFDIILHAGSLIAILLYFSKIWKKILIHPFRREQDGSPPLLILLIIAFVPLGFTGLLVGHWVQEFTRTPLFVSFGFLFTGTFLIVSEWFETRYAARESVGWRQAIGAGFGQALAILPGFSRSGITLASGRLMGLTAIKATEFAFMLGVPALGAALVYSLLNGVTDLSIIGWMPLLTGFVTSLVSSVLIIHFMMMAIRRYGLWIWSVYLFVAASMIIADEMMPIILSLQDVGRNLEVIVLVGILFMTLLLASTPFTSLFVPGFFVMATIAFLLRESPITLIACIPIGTVGMMLGHLIGYIPARQARLQIRWKEEIDQKLTHAQHFFKKWGISAVLIGGWYGPIRPFISIAAGLSGMRTIPFLATMMISSFLYVSVTMLGIAASEGALYEFFIRFLS